MLELPTSFNIGSACTYAEYTDYMNDDGTVSDTTVTVKNAARL